MSEETLPELLHRYEQVRASAERTLERSGLRLRQSKRLLKPDRDEPRR
jgi:hypothetical protein